MPFCNIKQALQTTSGAKAGRIVINNSHMRQLQQGRWLQSGPPRRSMRRRCGSALLSGGRRPSPCARAHPAAASAQRAGAENLAWTSPWVQCRARGASSTGTRCSRSSTCQTAGGRGRTSSGLAGGRTWWQGCKKKEQKHRQGREVNEVRLVTASPWWPWWEACPLTSLLFNGSDSPHCPTCALLAVCAQAGAALGIHSHPAEPSPC